MNKRDPSIKRLRRNSASKFLEIIAFSVDYFSLLGHQMITLSVITNEENKICPSECPKLDWLHMCKVKQKSLSIPHHPHPHLHPLQFIAIKKLYFYFYFIFILFHLFLVVSLFVKLSFIFSIFLYFPFFIFCLLIFFFISQ
jgi:hypothetical protein